MERHFSNKTGVTYKMALIGSSVKTSLLFLSFAKMTPVFYIDWKFHDSRN